jgi:hypothetical protein
MLLKSNDEAAVSREKCGPAADVDWPAVGVETFAVQVTDIETDRAADAETACH